MNDSQNLKRPLGVNIIYWYTVISFFFLLLGFIGISLFDRSAFESLHASIWDGVIAAILAIIFLYAGIYLHDLNKKAVPLYLAWFVIGLLGEIINTLEIHFAGGLWSIVLKYIESTLLGVIILCYALYLRHRGILM